MMRQGIYILPSIFTLTGMTFGILAILLALAQYYTTSAWFILAAIVLDMLDGRIARWTSTESRFGIELDSFADFLSFGMAPAVLMYQLRLNQLDKPGIAIVIFYVIGAALRLSRYNVRAQENIGSSGDFVGLPVPGAAGILASFVLSYQLFEAGQEITVKSIKMLSQRMPFFFNTIPGLMILLTILMLSPLRYSAFKSLRLDRPHSWQMLVIVVVALLLIISYPQNSIFLLFLLYIISGIADYFIRINRLHRRKNI
jgi:CDP-diacylglycerol--serine O-phosphatidyltransferase